MTPILNSDKALRKVRRSEINAAGRIRKSAFMPRAQGQDSDGLSVSIENAALTTLHQQRFETTDACAVALLVGAVRGLELDVVPDPDPGDPAHALITGIPDRRVCRENLERAERFAEQLARLAASYTF